MARFMYQARDGKGEMTSGVVAADNLDAASQLLRADGNYIIRLTEVVDADADDDDPQMSVQQHSRRVKRQDVIYFSHQMAVMIETGVPITEALECIVEQAPNPHFAAVLRAVTDDVEGGGEFSVALKKFPHVFPTIMTSLLRASEVSGTMGRMLERISRYLAKERKIQRQARGALAYPCFMMLVAVSVTVFLMLVVLPKFAGIYSAKGSALPVPTQLLLGISDVMIGYWWALLGGLAGGVAGLWIASLTAAGRRGFDWLKLHTPIARKLFTQLYVTRACRTMGTMIHAGVSMMDTIAIVKDVTQNAYYRDLWDEVEESLQQGLQLSDPLFRSTLIPRSIVQMLRSGEKSGRLGEVMNRIADFTEEEFDEAVKTTTQFIEPVMVIVMGGLVGFIAIALLLPIFSVGKVVAGG